MHSNTKSLIAAAAITGALFAPLGVDAAGIPIDEARGGIPTLAPILEHTAPGVVSIVVTGARQVTQRNGQQAQRQVQGAGSGVIVDAAKGYVLTNNHVIDGATTMSVRLSDGRTFDAKLIGTDDATDVALLQIPAEKLTAVPFGDSAGLKVGDFVIAVGNPFGLGQTVTSGIVSALGRGGMNIEGYEDFIQTDASINPGNSGGALLDMNGKLVGINTAIIGPSGGNIGIGFAVPTNMVRSVMDQLVAFGDVKRGKLGVEIADVNQANAAKLGTTAGAVITRVVPGSAAEKAGLTADDVVVSINGTQVRDARDLANRVGLVRMGGKATLVVVRNGKKQTIEVTVTEAQAADAGTKVAPRPAVFGGPTAPAKTAPRGN